MRIHCTRIHPRPPPQQSTTRADTRARTTAHLLRFATACDHPGQCRRDLGGSEPLAQARGSVPLRVVVDAQVGSAAECSGRPSYGEGIPMRLPTPGTDWYARLLVQQEDTRSVLGKTTSAPRCLQLAALIILRVHFGTTCAHFYALMIDFVRKSQIRVRTCVH